MFACGLSSVSGEFYLSEQFLCNGTEGSAAGERSGLVSRTRAEFLHQEGEYELVLEVLENEDNFSLNLKIIPSGSMRRRLNE